MRAASAQDTSAVTTLRETLAQSGSSLENIRQSVDGQDMLISRYRSENTGFQITIAHPTDVSYARVRHLRNLILLTMLAALVIGTLASYIFSRRNSRLPADAGFQQQQPDGYELQPGFPQHPSNL